MFFQMIEKMINYQQAHRHSREDGESPRDYYDPSIMLAEKHYRLGAKEEIMIVINGSGYRYNDDTLYALNISTDDNPVIGHSYQLCLIVKNCSSNLSIYVGNKSPLQWLLDMPRVVSKLCFCSIADLTRLRLSLNSCGEDEVDDDVPMFTAAADETIVINY